MMTSQKPAISETLLKNISTHKDHPQVNCKYLAATESQLREISQHYVEKKEVSLVFAETAADQGDAQQFMQLYGLDRTARDRLESRWNVTWSTGWNLKNGDGGDKRRRCLLQCASGHHSEVRHHADQQNNPYSRGSSTLGSRRNPYLYTGCIAHVELTERESDGQVTRIVGILEHNEGCRNSVMTRFPPIPLHPHVYEVALAQLRSGASITSIQSKNVEMMDQHLYRDMSHPGSTDNTANVRYDLLPSDMSQLYRLLNKSYGVDMSATPEDNLHSWMDPSSPAYRADIRDAIFYYQARAQQEDRLKVCISTKAMDEAAWKYAHGSQLILDGTFGVCSSRLLLFIAMGIDEEGKGVPLALFLFSAPTGNRATHAGYNRAILQELLLSWCTHLSRNRPTMFYPLVCITDTDTKERGALLDVWPEIWLLLCRFHVRSCWTNKRKTLFAGDDFWKQYMLRRIQELERQLLSTTEHTHAAQLLAAERTHAVGLVRSGLPAQAACDATIKYIDYFEATWLPQALWCSWSQKGRNTASMILHIPVEGVLPTTNHLESFNGVLKRKYIPRWQRSGSRLCFDFLISILITHILPDIFSSRLARRNYLNWLSNRFSSHAGGLSLHATLPVNGNSFAGKSICWWQPEQQRDADAVALLQRGNLHTNNILRHSPCDGFEAKCNSSSILGHSYQLELHCCGYGHCSCPDFVHCGGACKHLRALRLIIDDWVTRQLTSPLNYPSSIRAANSVPSHQPYTSVPSSHPSALAPNAPALYTTGKTGSAAINTMLALQQITTNHQTDGCPQVESISNFADSSKGTSTESESADQGPSTTLSTHHDAVAMQIQQRVEHDIKKLLPMIHGLSVLVSDSKDLPRTEGLDEFEDTLITLSRDLLQALPPRSRTRPSSCSRQQLVRARAPAPPRSPPAVRNSGKRGRPTGMLPPSPEARQKRKTSNGYF